MSRGRGSVTVEMVLLAPVLVLFVTFVVAVGRHAQAVTTVRHAAGAAAREASLVSTERMRAAATDRAEREFLRAAEWCTGGRTEVRLTRSHGVSGVTVQASCEVNRDGIFSVLPVRLRVSAMSTEVIDAYSYR